MLDSSTISELLLGAVRILWILIYLECIRVGFRDRACAMPFHALVLNMSWELVYTAKAFARSGTSEHTLALAAWLALDVLIFYTYVRFETVRTAHAVSTTTPNNLRAIAIRGLLTYGAVLLASRMMTTYMASNAFVLMLSLIMSLMFLQLLTERKSTIGQSLGIAIGKLVAALLLGAHYLTRPAPLELAGLCLLIAGCDAVYLWRLRNQFKCERSNGQ